MKSQPEQLKLFSWGSSLAGDGLSQARALLGVSREELALRSAVPVALLTTIEAGGPQAFSERLTALRALRRLAVPLGLDGDALVQRALDAWAGEPADGDRAPGPERAPAPRTGDEAPELVPVAVTGAVRAVTASLPPVTRPATTPTGTLPAVTVLPGVVTTRSSWSGLTAVIAAGVPGGPAPEPAPGRTGAPAPPRPSVQLEEAPTTATHLTAVRTKAADLTAPVPAAAFLPVSVGSPVPPMAGAGPPSEAAADRPSVEPDVSPRAGPFPSPSLLRRAMGGAGGALLIALVLLAIVEVRPGWLMLDHDPAMTAAQATPLGRTGHAATGTASPPATGAHGPGKSDGGSPSLSRTAQSPSSATYEVSGSELTVAVSTSAPCWLEVTTPDRPTPILATVLHADSQRRFSNYHALTVRVGASGVSLRVRSQGRWTRLLSPPAAPYDFTFVARSSSVSDPSTA